MSIFCSNTTTGLPISSTGNCGTNNRLKFFFQIILFTSICFDFSISSLIVFCLNTIKQKVLCLHYTQLLFLLQHKHKSYVHIINNCTQLQPMMFDGKFWSPITISLAFFMDDLDKCFDISLKF